MENAGYLIAFASVMTIVITANWLFAAATLPAELPTLSKLCIVFYQVSC